MSSQPARSNAPVIGPAEYAMVRQLLHQRTGILLEGGKEYFVELRLGALANEEGFGSVQELLDSLATEEAWGVLHRRVVESLAISETSFFRDLHPFEALRLHVLPELVQRRHPDRALNLWCAAAASGQEPYSVAMLLREHFPQLSTWKLQLVASDFSAPMLKRCREGAYSQIEINRGLPAPYMLRYFRKDGTEWRVRDEVRAMIEFRELNLAAAWPALPPMDIVLLRNVLIYLDGETRRSVLRKLLRVLRPDGWLFVGGGETTLTLDDSFEPVTLGRTVAYRPRPRAGDREEARR